MKKIFAFLTALAAPLFVSPLFGEEVTEAAVRGGSLSQTMIMIGIAIVFFYFILWRPEKKRRKKMEEQRSSLKKGDQVTAMGIVGTISRVQENTVVLRMVDGAKIEMLKGAITDVKPAAATEVLIEEKSEATT